MAKLPAFAKALIAKRRRGLAPAARDLCIATDWSLGKSWPWRVVVPVPDDPQMFDYGVVAGLSCILMGRDRARMDAIARAVITFAPKRLVGVHFGGSAIIVYLPSEIPLERAA